ncbi:sphingosine kinase related protein [Cavenderia fasciculata]|uniref:Sphingosine kinase related protein n=1 Tax=Cavenderia fasciculata TaxID=261658 RepID=F4PKH6_CACFS|nr:sphingosine kinase related protein [Cavenderia fasciculata]EGG24100.1 sphingosine kinase related protein [Cavenderia fasciculata]|eukprot:XP_004361951.1 sphingosine kinase related protein [Cavenderia fasciculata]
MSEVASKIINIFVGGSDKKEKKMDPERIKAKEAKKQEKKQKRLSKKLAKSSSSSSSAVSSGSASNSPSTTTTSASTTTSVITGHPTSSSASIDIISNSNNTSNIDTPLSSPSSSLNESTDSSTTTSSSSTSNSFSQVIPTIDSNGTIIYDFSGSTDADASSPVTARGDKSSPQGADSGLPTTNRRSWSEQIEADKEAFVVEQDRDYSADNSVINHPSFNEPSRAKRIKVQNIAIIYNPFSGSKIGEKIMNEARKYFEVHGLNVKTIPTEYKGHAEVLCRDMDVSTIDAVCLVGGDGTIHEAVNGIMKRDPESREKSRKSATVVARSSASSSRRWPTSTSTAASCRSRSTRSVARSKTSKRCVPTFSWTLAHTSPRKTRTTPKSYTASTRCTGVSAARSMSPPRRCVGWARPSATPPPPSSSCSRVKRSWHVSSAAKGMKMAPKAKLNDGLIDLILIKSHKTFDLMNVFTKVYDGTHTQLDYVIYKQVRRFSITPFKKDKERKRKIHKEKKRIRSAKRAGLEHHSNPLEILKTECNTILSQLEDQVEEEIIDVDGELVGTTPFVCEIIPRSIRVVAIILLYHHHHHHRREIERERWIGN